LLSASHATCFSFGSEKTFLQGGGTGEAFVSMAAA
jgi:hypothetical protein